MKKNAAGFANFANRSSQLVPSLYLFPKRFLSIFPPAKSTYIFISKGVQVICMELSNCKLLLAVVSVNKEKEVQNGSTIIVSVMPADNVRFATAM